MKKIKILFVGTGDVGMELFSSLAIHESFEVLALVTGPDKPVGRKLISTPPAIKKVALDLGIPVIQPTDINADETVKKLKRMAPDMAVLMAFGQLLSQTVLDIPASGFLNVHASLLPKYRGASPIQSTILAGEQETGISFMRMVKEMDAGPIYLRKEISISEDDTYASLSEKLGLLAAKIIPAALAAVHRGELKPAEQDDAVATFCKKIEKKDGLIRWNDPVQLILRKIRAFTPWPGTYTFFKGKRLKILSARAGTDSSKAPGTVTSDGICCGDGLIKPLELQLEGKNVQNFEDFVNGYPDFIGSQLSSST